MVNGSKQYPENEFVGCSFMDIDEKYKITFDNEESCVLKEYTNGKISLLNRYDYTYTDGTYILIFNTAKFIPADDESESYKKDLTLVVVDKEILFLSKYNTYIYLV